MKKYAQIVSKCWETLLHGNTPNGSYFFSKTDLEKAAEMLNFNIKNIADIRYTFDSREDLPFPGYGILQQGKGKYVFVPVEKNLINIEDIDEAYLCKDQVIGIANKYMTNDEQGRFARLVKSDALNKIFGWSSFQKIQDHWRTTSEFGQIEIDSLCSFTKNDKESILIINVKKDSDRISKTYLYNQARLAAEKFADSWQILNIYCIDDIYLIWEPENLNNLNDISVKKAIAVKLY